MPADVITGVGLLLSATEAAKFLGVSRSKFYLIRESFPVIVLPDGTKRYNREQLEWWLAHNTQMENQNV